MISDVVVSVVVLFSNSRFKHQLAYTVMCIIVSVIFLIFAEFKRMCA